jgi:hypothetical protein
MAIVVAKLLTLRRIGHINSSVITSVRLPFMQNYATPVSESPLAGDILRGIRQIAEFLGEPNQRCIAYECGRGYIPCGKQGGQWIASKRRLREHYAELTGGGGAADSRDSSA